MKFDVLNRWTGSVQFTAEIECAEDEVRSVKLGLAVKWAFANGASLDGARLDGARLDGASLVGARLDERALRPIRADFFDILLRARNEVPALLVALREGRIDGSTYTGACACLCGTIANVRHVNVETLDFRDSDRPAEVWFMAINQGDTPETNTVAKITEGWIEEFLAITSPAQEPAAA
jgi:hypothetical protein